MKISSAVHHLTTAELSSQIAILWNLRRGKLPHHHRFRWGNSVPPKIAFSFLRADEDNLITIASTLKTHLALLRLQNLEAAGAVMFR
jgi:hypothetical protein